MNESDIEQFVDSLPENGEWWKSGDRDSLIEAVTILVNQDVDTEQIKRVVEMIYSAVASEYGD